MVVFDLICNFYGHQYPSELLMATVLTPEYTLHDPSSKPELFVRMKTCLASYEAACCPTLL